MISAQDFDDGIIVDEREKIFIKQEGDHYEMVQQCCIWIKEAPQTHLFEEEEPFFIEHKPKIEDIQIGDRSHDQYHSRILPHVLNSQPRQRKLKVEQNTQNSLLRASLQNNYDLISKNRLKRTGGNKRTTNNEGNCLLSNQLLGNVDVPGTSKDIRNRTKFTYYDQKDYEFSTSKEKQGDLEFITVCHDLSIRHVSGQLSKEITKPYSYDFTVQSHRNEQNSLFTTSHQNNHAPVSKKLCKNKRITDRKKTSLTFDQLSRNEDIPGTSGGINQKTELRSLDQNDIHNEFGYQKNIVKEEVESVEITNCQQDVPVRRVSKRSTKNVNRRFSYDFELPKQNHRKRGSLKSTSNINNSKPKNITFSFENNVREMRTKLKKRPDVQLSFDRRSMHNSQERLRRLEMSDSFDKLRELVPSIMNNKLAPKIKILEKALSYINKLKFNSERLKRMLFIEEQRNINLCEILKYSKENLDLSSIPIS